MMGFNTHYLLLFVFFIINLTNKIFYLPGEVVCCLYYGSLNRQDKPNITSTDGQQPIPFLYIKTIKCFSR